MIREPLAASPWSSATAVIGVAAPLLLGMAALYLLLPRPRPFRTLPSALVGLGALGWAGGTWLALPSGSIEDVLFVGFAGLAVIAGALLVTQANAARAALAFAIVVLSSSGLFLLLAAPFLLAATIIVYAGAIIVTFLFVLMLAQQEGWSSADRRSREPLLSVVAGTVLLGALLFVAKATYDTRPLDHLVAALEAAAGQSSADAIRQTLGTAYRQLGPRTPLKPEEEQRLGDDGKFFVALRQYVQAARGASERDALDRELEVMEFEWRELEHVPLMQGRLKELARAVARVRDGMGTVPLPAEVPRSPLSLPAPGDPERETVAPLGRALLTDFLLPIELGGALLLVATVGAVVIAGRRTEGAR
ncbi:MAG: NADH-quinone oxidoreductase subunit J [Gemmataceae bacterium]|nr:NADH-quinone oxidoreductase subunit J [Gemmataceae bacterium]MDW8267342.1 NADH-quinone oxidoreductase subunit J [Gemmataceae bacterium]